MGNREAVKELETKKKDRKLNKEEFKSTFEVSNHKNTTKGKGGGKPGLITIINSNNGKRIVISEKISKLLGLDEEVMFALAEDSIAISEEFGGGGEIYNLKELGAKKVVYAAELIKEITEKYSLDYSERTSITFYKKKTRTLDGKKVAIIKMV